MIQFSNRHKLEHMHSKGLTTPEEIAQLRRLEEKKYEQSRAVQVHYHQRTACFSRQVGNFDGANYEEEKARAVELGYDVAYSGLLRTSPTSMRSEFHSDLLIATRPRNFLSSRINSVID